LHIFFFLYEKPCHHCRLYDLVDNTNVVRANKAEPNLKPEVVSLAYFQGAWNCDGIFSNGKNISSAMVFHPDLDGAWLVVRHDDRPPNIFHAAEMWGF